MSGIVAEFINILFYQLVSSTLQNKLLPIVTPNYFIAKIEIVNTISHNQNRNTHFSQHMCFEVLADCEFL